MLRLIYSAVLYCLTPLLVLRLYWLSVKTPASRERIPERFGWTTIHGNNSPLLWVHAVSVGEVQATRPLIKAVRVHYPQFRILLTTTTPTGAETVKQLYQDTVTHRYMPYDLPGAVGRFCQRLHPDLFIAMETEIWPNLFHTCHKNDIPVIIANARLSAASLAGYKKLVLLARETLSKVTCIIAQSHTDADRFMELGVERDKIRVTGNLKFDVPESESFAKQAGELKKLLGTSARKVWLAASTHDREEQIILESHARILAQIPQCLLIIAPRHPERFNEVVRLARKAGFSVLKMTDKQAVTSNIQVFILDTLGDLPACYTQSDIAFIGGSLVAAGGHNPLEPASRSVPVLFGPHTSNFSDICRNLQDCGAAMVVKDAASLAQTVLAFLNDSDKCRSAGDAARTFVESNRGSVDAMLAELRPLLKKAALRRGR